MEVVDVSGEGLYGSSPGHREICTALWVSLLLLVCGNAAGKVEIPTLKGSGL